MVPDPQDDLYGIRLAVHARLAGLRYQDTRTFALLFQEFKSAYETSKEGRTEDPDEEAYQLYEFIVSRLDDLMDALEIEDNSEGVLSDEMLADPQVVVEGIRQMRIDINSLAEEIADGNEAMTAEEYAEYEEAERRCIEDGRFYIWAAYQAKRHGIGADELSEFIYIFCRDWFELMEQLLSKNTLAPGVLNAFNEARADTGKLIKDGPGLVRHWTTQRLDLPLTEYLDSCLTAAGEC